MTLNLFVGYCASARRLFILQLQTLGGNVLSEPVLGFSFLSLCLTYHLCPCTTVVILDVTRIPALKIDGLGSDLLYQEVQ